MRTAIWIVVLAELPSWLCRETNESRDYFACHKILVVGTSVSSRAQDRYLPPQMIALLPPLFAAGRLTRRLRLFFMWSHGVKSFHILVALLASAQFSERLRSAPPDKNTFNDGFKQVSRDVLDVADGQVGQTGDGYLTIASPEVRATEIAQGAKAARLVFVFHGPTEQESKLASGEVARQIGLKLRAKNTCNLLYAMWKLEGEERIVVSVKRNPGMSTHQECGASGYVKIQPAFQATKDKFPSPQDGKPHTLEAQVLKADAKSYELIVKADGIVAWKGLIDASLLDDVDGPAGFRTDNGAFTFRFYSLEPSQVRYGDWKEDKKKDCFVCEYKYPSKNNSSRVGNQLLIWYPNDSERKDYYFFASKGNQLWGRCVCPKSVEYDRKEIKWSVFEKNKWTNLPAGACPAPKDGYIGRASIDRIPDLPDTAGR